MVDQTQEKKKVGANIQELVTQLNRELVRAKELGLNIYISPSNPFSRETTRISVRVWEELDYVRLSG